MTDTTPNAVARTLERGRIVTGAWLLSGERSRRVLEAARENDVTPGIAGRTPEAVRRRADRGFRFFLVGADLSFVRRGAEGMRSE